MLKSPSLPQRFFSFGAGMAVGFGAGLALRASLPRATEFAGLFLEKLGFEITDLILMFWDPEAGQRRPALPAPKAAAPMKMANRVKVIAEPKSQRSTKKAGKTPVNRRSARPSALPTAKRSQRTRPVVIMN